ncbi:MAG: bifunctional [glutamine synthetase] adenylyltransferase/[glutamine synthetase]-adenylyl-L-tyrosine phosphorylase [Hellea sp.]|nr:bifunctional [glutamine synthetase] adenylyltransferase/[glutamine synthetase]-adenylyl-L-tyrosine phosphorylase [Hellea sp.]
MMSSQQAVDCARNNSSYLKESLNFWPTLSDRFLKESPEQILSSLFESISGSVGDLDTEMVSLRQLKRQCHLIIALSDISQCWSWVEVTEYLSQLADIAMSRILRASALAQNIDGTDENPVPGLFVLAVGKYGARELNYSSDIDFNVFYDPELVTMPNPARPERALIKTIQGLIRGMEAITTDGYIFRTDLRLRPDPRSNAIAVSTHTAERYYESLGQNWERAAMIKARCCAGDKACGEEFIEQILTPFIWRKNLDYAAIDDIMAIKRQIHQKIGDDGIRIAGHHLKLGTGGIREIEFYAQVQQLILGGRHPELRETRTVSALDQLAQKGFVEPDEAEAMKGHYGFLRKLEHAAQMMADEQTHKVPEDAVKQNQFADLAGYESFETLSSVIRETLFDVRQIYAALFPNAETLSSSAGNMVFTGVDPDPGTLATFSELGFRNGDQVWHDMAAWLGGRINATRSERARELLTALAPRLIDILASTGQPDRAFSAFSGFITRLNSGVTVFSMFLQRTRHLDFFISLLVRSDRMANWAATRPGILDALSDPDFLHVDEHSILEGQDSVLASDDFESAINLSRRWAREQKFRIGAALLSQQVSPKVAGQLYSKLAIGVIHALVPASIAEVERRRGPISGSVCILAMGKLASRDLSLNSDLDIMLLYQPIEGEDAGLFAKITQRLVSALSAVTEEGPLYDVDMALRPSGRAGPVAVTFESFRRYYEEKAWTWEFMALSRSSVIYATSPEAGRELERIHEQALRSERPDLSISKDVGEMLNLLRKEKPPHHAWDLKNIVGGIRDIEFIAQKMFLLNRSNFSQTPKTISETFEAFPLELGAKSTQKLIEIYDLYLATVQCQALVQAESKEPPTHANQQVLAELTGFKTAEELKRNLDKNFQFVQSLVEKYIFTPRKGSA